jgi:hypothetical protein
VADRGTRSRPSSSCSNSSSSGSSSRPAPTSAANVPSSSEAGLYWRKYRVDSMKQAQQQQQQQQEEGAGDEDGNSGSTLTYGHEAPLAGSLVGSLRRRLQAGGGRSGQPEIEPDGAADSAHAGSSVLNLADETFTSQLQQQEQEEQKQPAAASKESIGGALSSQVMPRWPLLQEQHVAEQQQDWQQDWQPQQCGCANACMPSAIASCASTTSGQQQQQHLMEAVQSLATAAAVQAPCRQPVPPCLPPRGGAAGPRSTRLMLRKVLQDAAVMGADAAWQL